MPNTFSLFYNRSKRTMKSIPSLFHLFIFLSFVIVAVLSLNFEVFRVLRIGDALIILMAILVGMHWYGQKMQEAGYQDALKQSRNYSSNKKTA